MAYFHAKEQYWNHEDVDVSKITRLELLYDEKAYVTVKAVIKEPSDTVSISNILQIPMYDIESCINWDLKVESFNGIKMWNLEVQHNQRHRSKSIIAYKPEYYVNFYDPWMMDSCKTTNSVLRKRSIPTDLIYMIQDYT